MTWTLRNSWEGTTDWAVPEWCPTRLIFYFFWLNSPTYTTFKAWNNNIKAKQLNSKQSLKKADVIQSSWLYISYHFTFFLGFWFCLRQVNTEGTKSGLSNSVDASPIKQTGLNAPARADNPAISVRNSCYRSPPDTKWALQTRAFPLSPAVLPFASCSACSHKRLRLAWNGRVPDGTL